MISTGTSFDDLEFTPSDIDRVLTTTFIQSVDYYEELPSTNTRALELAAELGDGGPSPRLVVARRQTAGRGRGSNRWWSSPGSLTFSLLFLTEGLQLQPNSWPQLSLAAGLAICDAIEHLVSGSRPCLKWPNDVVVDGRKVSGILMEIADIRRGSFVVGIGVNVNNAVKSAPPELRENVITLSDLSDDTIYLVDVLVAILQQLESRINWLLSDPDTLQSEWSRRCILTGRTVEIDILSRRIRGVCDGIDADGALLLNTPSGIERCLSGTILRFD